VENRPIIGGFTGGTSIFGLDEISYESSPKIGKEVFEMWQGAVHPGHDIHVLENTVGKSKDEIKNILLKMDDRVLQGMPQEVVEAIESGNISDIYRTNPALSEKFQELPESVKKSLGGPENTGSIYFRRSTGETARWKLPEIASGDAGWNANKGAAIFSDATVYLDNTYPLTKSNAFTKKYGKLPQFQATDELKTLIDSNPYFSVQGNIERVKAGEKSLLIARNVNDISPAAPTPTSGPSLDAIKAAMGDSLPSSVEPDTPKKLTPEQQSKLDEVIEAQRQHKEAVENSVGSTKKAIEQDGYLYHYAPREARDSILAEGLLPSKASTGDVLDNGIYFFTNPKDAPSASSVMAVSGRTSVDSAGLDLYRVKVDPDMLDGMVIDSKLPIRGNVASAVVVPTKTGSFIPELIGENARFESSGELLDLFSKADYDPIVTDSAPSATAKVVSETAAVEPIAKEHSPRKIAALEEMAENGTVHEKEIAKRKLEEIKNTQNRVRGSGLNIGTPTDDIRTRPTPKGTDAASRSVVDSGGTRPIINVEPPKPDTIKPPVDKPADVSAKITTDSTTPVKNVPDTSSRITKITSTGKTIKDNGMNVAKNISSGNARTMGIAAIAGLLGAGAYGLNKKKEEDIQSKVNRQRYGEM
jgi:hypothetical protein